MYVLSRGKNNLSTSHRSVNCAARGEGAHRGRSLSIRVYTYMCLYCLQKHIFYLQPKKKKNSRLSINLLIINIKANSVLTLKFYKMLHWGRG